MTTSAACSTIWKPAGQLDNTIIIYTADQGFMLGEHDYIDKRWMYEESLRMPFIVRYPRLIKAGSVSDAIINNVDFAPTILDLAGQTAPADMQGRSFVPDSARQDAQRLAPRRPTIAIGCT